MHTAPGGGKSFVGEFHNISVDKLAGGLPAQLDNRPSDKDHLANTEHTNSGHNVASVPGTALQRTLKNSIGCTGIGLHSGSDVNLMLRPAPSGTGIVFRRTDISGDAGDVLADVHNVVDAMLGTTIGNASGATVATIEHLMAALRGAGIDNLLIELDGPEIPIMDGSAAPFLFLIECTGTVAQNAPRRAIEVLKPVKVTDGNKSAEISPAPGFSLGFEIDFESATIGKQDMEIQLVNGNFKDILSRARTFGFTHEVEQLRALGLARGGSLDNAIVISSEGVLNEEGLRFNDEFVRHKILDSVGDLYLAGAPLIGHFHGVRSGHALNHMLLKKLLSDSSAWRYSIQTASSDRHISQTIVGHSMDVSAAIA